MGHGYLTGKYKPEDFGDMRSHLQRVNSEVRFSSVIFPSRKTST
jgi:hypothetical protein